MKPDKSKEKMRVADYCLLLMVFLVPLIIGYHRSPLSQLETTFMGRAAFIDLYNYWKVVVLSVLAGIVFLSLLAELLLGKRIEIEKKPLVLVGIFCATVLLSVLFSIDKTVAFRGLIDRYEGFLAWFSYLVIFIGSYEASLRLKSFKRYFVCAVMGSATIIGMVALFQYYGFTVLNLDIVRYAIAPDEVASAQKVFFVEGGTSASTLSNSNYMGGYAGAVSLIALWCVFQARNAVERIFMVGLTALVMSGIISSGSSAGLAGFTLTAPLLFYILSKKYGIRNTFVNFFAAIIGAGLLLSANTEKFDVPKELIFEVGFFIIAVAILHYRGNRLISFFSKGRNLAMIFAIVMAVGVVFSVQYGSRQIEKNMYLNAVKVEGNEVVLDFAAGKIHFYNDNGNIIVRDDAGVEKPVHKEMLPEGVTQFTVTDDVFKNVKYVVQKEPGYNILAIEPYSLVFVEQKGQFSWIGPGKTAAKIEGTEFAIKGIEKLGSGRGYIWSRTINIIPQHLLLGAGPDHFVFAFPQNDPAGKAMMGGANLYIDKPHNLYLKLIIEFGLAGLVGFLGLMWYSLKNGLRDCSRDTFDGLSCSVALALMSFGVSSIFNDSLPSITPVMMALMGVALANRSHGFET